ncbi:TMP repeat protein [Geobacillus phage GBSV1]|uniref:TMP repeat protein n=1 Tax=Geobacillus phage GBSV1 TaxID=365048 RepID=Q0H230_9CAUD|nr:tail length tape measure protein [Geobacillus phage GBSV1]ABC61285.1 TMP repeat protein [Geobacillus phage GBSV1]
MADRIKGITIEIGGDTIGLQKALQDVNAKSRELSKELRDVERLLKFDPGNVEAVAQKQRILAQQIEATTEKLNQLRSAQSQVEEQFRKGEIGEQQYRNFRREIEFTEAQLSKYKQSLQAIQDEQQAAEQSTKRLESLFKATGKSVDDFADVLGNKLVNAIKDGKASSAQLEDALGKIGQAVLGAGVDLDKMRQALDQLASGAKLDKVKKDLDEIAKAANSAEKDVQGLGETLSGVAGGLAAGGGLAGAINQALDTSRLNTKIDISFNVPEESKKAVKDAVNTIKAYGIDAETALEGVRRQWALNADASDEANQKIIEGAGMIASAYSGIDFTELIQEINEIGSELKISDEQALGLVNSLLQIGFPPDQLDIIAEYGQQLQRAGYDAQEIQAIFAAGIETGTWNIDNLLDGLKEGRIRLAEFGQGVDKATAELLEGTGISTAQLQEWGRAVAAGGEQGQKAMFEVAQALAGIKDATTQNALGVKIFGTMWEDQGTNITETILNMNKHLADAKNNQDLLNDSISKINADPAVKFQKAIGDLKTALEPLMSVIASVVGAIASWMSANPQLSATITAIVGAVGIFSGALMALAPILYSIQNVLPIITKMLPMLGNAFKAMTGPIGLAITVLTLLVPVIIKNWEPIKEFFSKLWDGIKKIFETTVNAIGSFLSSAWEGIRAAAQAVWNGIKAYFETVLNVYKTIFTVAWNAIRTAVVAIWNGLKTTAITVFDALKNAISNAWNAVKTVTTTVWNAIKSMVTSVMNGIQQAISTAINAVKNIVTAAWNAIKSLTSSVWNSIKSFVMTHVNAIRDAVPTAFEAMKNRIASVWEGVKNVIKAPLNAVISIINSFIGRLNTLKIPDWVPGVGGKGINIPKIPMLAKGTDYFRGGYAIVGEQGPELVQLPRGSKVYPNTETMGMLGGNISINIQNMTVRDERDIEKISRELYVLIERSKRSRGSR